MRLKDWEARDGGLVGLVGASEIITTCSEATASGLPSRERGRYSVTRLALALEGMPCGISVQSTDPFLHSSVHLYILKKKRECVRNWRAVFAAASSLVQTC